MRVLVYVRPIEKKPDFPIIHSVWTTPEEATDSALAILKSEAFTEVILVVDPDVSGKSSVDSP